MSAAIDSALLDRVLAAYDFGRHARAEPIASGLINHTFAIVGDEGKRVAVVQRLHPIFSGEVNLDIAAVTDHLVARGLCTPRIIPARSGDLYLTVDDRVWRALTYVDGVCLEAVPDEATAHAAGELVGRFHRATRDFQKPLAFARAGVHDTERHLARLAALCAQAPAPEPEIELRETRDLGREILAIAGHRAPLPAALPARLCHGDLKISNLLFTDTVPPTGKCLIDLDTLCRQTIALELGDALRSWCNPHTEDHAGAHLDIGRFRAALTGYAAGAGALLSADEIAAIPIGLETISIELAARFCVDAFEDRYFGWDPSRFSSRRVHNLARGRGQLSLARSVIAHREKLARLAGSVFGERPRRRQPTPA